MLSEARPTAASCGSFRRRFNGRDASLQNFDFGRCGTVRFEGQRIRQHLSGLAPDQLAVSIINYEEQMRGWLARAAQANTIERMLTAYARLQTHIETFRDIPILPFDGKAAAEFAKLQKANIRIGTMDLKIAAIALANNATLLTRNLSDFNKVPSLKAEDWT